MAVAKKQESLLEQFPELTQFISYEGDVWFKIQKKSRKEIDEVDARNIITKNVPTIFDDYTLNDIKKAFRSSAAIGKKTTLFESEIDFIKAVNKEHQFFDVRASGELHELNGVSAITQRLKMLAEDYNRLNKPEIRMKITSIQDALAIVVDDMRQEKLEIIKEKVKFNPKIPDRFDDLLHAMRVTENQTIHKAAIKHYIWLVKRKLNGFEPKYHFMLILYCKKQGFGKSGFLKQFHAPIQEVHTFITGDTIKDKFSVDMFTKNYAVTIDELAALESTTADELKEFVTRGAISSRRMFTEINQSFKQNATLSGTSNRPINKLIFDPTGMRRWWQIDLNTDDYQKMDFAKLDAWEKDEFLDFWRSIDENDPIGYYGGKAKMAQEMEQYQLKFRSVPPVEQFLEESNYRNEYKKKKSTKTDKVELDKMWNEWRYLCHRGACRKFQF